MELSAAPEGAAGQAPLPTSTLIGIGLDRNKIELRPALAMTSASNVPVKSFYSPIQGWWRAGYKACLSELRGLMTWQLNHQAGLLRGRVFQQQRDLGSMRPSQPGRMSCCTHTHQQDI